MANFAATALWSNTEEPTTNINVSFVSLFHKYLYKGEESCMDLPL